MTQGFLRAFKLIVILGVPLLAFVYAYQFTGQPRDKVVPFRSFQVPSTSLLKPDGSKTQIEFNSPVTVVNFWATNCPPCVEEFPAMIELQRILEDKGLEIVFVSVDPEWDLVESFFEEHVIEVKGSRLYWDPKKEAAEAWGSAKFPESYVVRADSWIVEKIIGFQQWTRPQVIEYFESLGSKFEDYVVASWFWPDSLYAQSSKRLLHEKDKKTLETLRNNIDTAAKNLRNLEAELKKENRSIVEQDEIVKRRKREQEEAFRESQKARTQVSELQRLLQKNQSSLKAEEREKVAVEKELETSKKKISELEKRLEDERDRLAQIQKTLNRRIQQVETSEEAIESSQKELNELSEKSTGSQKALEEQREKTRKALEELGKRKMKSRSLSQRVKNAEQELDKQKKKLRQAEELLKE